MSQIRLKANPADIYTYINSRWPVNPCMFYQHLNSNFSAINTEKCIFSALACIQTHILALADDCVPKYFSVVAEYFSALFRKFPTAQLNGEMLAVKFLLLLRFNGLMLKTSERPCEEWWWKEMLCKNFTLLFFFFFFALLRYYYTYNKTVAWFCQSTIHF